MRKGQGGGGGPCGANTTSGEAGNTRNAGNEGAGMEATDAKEREERRDKSGTNPGGRSHRPSDGRVGSQSRSDGEEHNTEDDQRRSRGAKSNETLEEERPRPAVPSANGARATLKGSAGQGNCRAGRPPGDRECANRPVGRANGPGRKPPPHRTRNRTSASRAQLPAAQPRDPAWTPQRPRATGNGAGRNAEGREKAPGGNPRKTMKTESKPGSTAAHTPGAAGPHQEGERAGDPQPARAETAAGAQPMNPHRATAARASSLPNTAGP
nr:uncharacterized protein LOC112076247 [Salvelinus alpinus]